MRVCVCKCACACVCVCICVGACVKGREGKYICERERGEDKKQRNITEATVEFIESSFHRWFDLLLSLVKSCITASAVFFYLRKNFVAWLLNETV